MKNFKHIGFLALAKKVTLEYQKQGVPAKKAKQIGFATAYKVKAMILAKAKRHNRKKR